MACMTKLQKYTALLSMTLQPNKLLLMGLIALLMLLLIWQPLMF
jgi:hypothetical protein